MWYPNPGAVRRRDVGPGIRRINIRVLGVIIFAAKEGISGLKVSSKCLIEYA
jgi:hypothetical protein